MWLTDVGSTHEHPFGTIVAVIASVHGRQGAAPSSVITTQMQKHPRISMKCARTIERGRNERGEHLSGHAFS